MAKAQRKQQKRLLSRQATGNFGQVGKFFYRKPGSQNRKK